MIFPYRQPPNTTVQADVYSLHYGHGCGYWFLYLMRQYVTQGTSVLHDATFGATEDLKFTLNVIIMSFKYNIQNTSSGLPCRSAQLLQDAQRLPEHAGSRVQPAFLPDLPTLDRLSKVSC